MTRKPPVRAIRGRFRRDVISQADLQELADAQATEWRANRLSQRLSLRIEARMAEGAGVQTGDLIFDQDLKMARAIRTSPTRKEKVS